jgi:hypothetical protein
MMRFGKLFLAAAAVGLPASVSSAAITAFWEQRPITATTDGVTPPPGIAGYETWDLMITLTPGDDFTSFRLLMDPAGQIFHHALGQGAPNFGPPSSALEPTFPAVVFDSYLRGPADGVTVLGSTDGTNDLPPPGIFDNNRLAVAAGDLSANTQGGTFQLLRMTFQPGVAPNPVYPSIAAGTLLGRVFSVQNDQGVQIPDIPEPTMMGLVAAAGLLAIRRR